MEYYVLPNKAEADKFLAERLNGNKMLPIKEESGYRMDKWAEESRELVDGRACIPRIPDALLKHHNVHINTITAMRNALVAAGGTIEELTTEDFPVAEVEI